MGARAGRASGATGSFQPMHPRHVTQRRDDIFPLRQRKAWLAAGDRTDGLVRPEQDVQFAQPRGLLQKTEIGGVKLVQSGGDDNPGHGGAGATRTLMLNDPGTDSGATTIR